MRYDSVHRLLKKTRGPASSYPCFECGYSADQWAYNHKDSNELTDQKQGFTIKYSDDPQFYDPLCHSCHHKLDTGYPEICTESDCNKPHHSKGLCQMHYRRKRRELANA